jgi:hypothetical protein
MLVMKICSREIVGVGLPALGRGGERAASTVRGSKPPRLAKANAAIERGDS